MNLLDWLVLLGTLLFIVAYGIYKTRGSQNIESYLMGDNSLKWWTIGLSVMATQASAITFLSTPGQAYESGMGFIQFYFGLPLAMVVLCIWVIPLYYRLKVYTAYEFLEKRFDLKTRLLAAFLFLIQRGLAAGITIYAPSIILSTILGWSLNLTILIIGLLVILYTVSGGTRAVSQTQKQQMAVMMGGMVVALLVLLAKLPEGVGVRDAVAVAGNMGKLNLIDTDFDLSNRYTLWSGLLGGFFLSLSYFGTDQSQVQRYLGGRSIAESRLGLLMNGLVKVPMQLLILFIGAMVFVFYQFYQPPVYYNQPHLQKVQTAEAQQELIQYQQQFNRLFEQKREAIDAALAGEEGWEPVQQLQEEEKTLRQSVRDVITTANPDTDVKDADYVFITFVLNYLPHGLIGLLLAVIFSAAMSSSAGELNALASTSVVDFYKRVIRQEGSDHHYLLASKGFTLAWGALALLFALTARQFENLIEFINIIGSLFYGTILGIFLVGFFFRRIIGAKVFYAALISEATVLAIHFFGDIEYLWYNFSCILVIALSWIFQQAGVFSSRK
ncbi:sodium:solute symporter [Cesiribacter sp. SM1]|uniref:sodium:solute symporter n=1 Tax=Cesiribacter sp. SM1 TaxID=2861196 RepID=UPI001CD57DBF|nr:sodium:solute symporter [Cesiribacter sp. SM1]